VLPSAPLDLAALAPPISPFDAEVDVTLIDEMLALSPLERLRQNDRVLRMIEELRDAIARDAAQPPRP
jgi:hypothetical protein